jgi:glycosyltransferase involved in cell wall biosynthesis
VNGMTSTQRMRVLILTSQLHEGAAELLAVDLAVDLNRLGAHAMVACMYSETMEGAARGKADILRRGVPSVHFLDLPHRPSPTQVLRGAARLRSILKRERIEILETSSPALGILGSIACMWSPVVHIAGLHQTFYRSEHKSLRERLFAFLTRLRRRTAFYAVSEYVRRTWITYSGTDETRTRVVHNGIVPTEPAPDRAQMSERLRHDLSILPTSKVALCVGRLAAYKRQDFLLEALWPACASGELTIVFAGNRDLTVPGTQEMLDKMDATIARNGLAPHVRFLGHRSDIDQLMSGADVLVHPTSKEAFGLVLAEAMAMGLPIVATRVEAIPEVVVEPDNILVDPGDAEAFRAAVIQMLARPSRHAEDVRVRNQARARMYRREARASKMLTVFTEHVSVHVEAHSVAPGSRAP